MKKIILILIAVVCAVTAVAQEATVKSFEPAPMDITAQMHAPTDRNGRKCALVKVQILAPDVEFSGNVMGSPERHSSEYWVYMTEGTKMLKIAAQTFLPLMFYFPEPLQGGITYVLTLSAPSTANSAGGPSAADIDLTDEYVRFEDPHTGKWGYKHRGKVIIPASFEEADQFLSGLALVRSNGKYGLIDKNGTLVIPTIYDVIEYGMTGDFRDGMTGVQLNGQWGFIDRTGAMIIPAVYVETRDFCEDLAAVRQSDKWGFVDRSGKMVIKPEYDDVFQFEDGLCNVKIDDLYGIIDTMGRIVVPVSYLDLGTFSEGLCAVCIGDDLKWGFVDHSGKMVIQPKYDQPSVFTEGLASVSLNGKHGYIDKTGRMVIPAVYDSADSFFDGKAFVSLNGDEFMIDRNGKEVKP